MSSQRYSPEFKDESVRQIIERGYSVTEVSERLGVSTKSPHKWLDSVRGRQRAAEKADMGESKFALARLTDPSKLFAA